MGIWDAFQVYNRNKHSSNPDKSGASHSNMSEGNTTYLYSHEVSEHSKKKKLMDDQLMAAGQDRKSSVSSDTSDDNNMMVMGSDGNPHMVDVSKLSQNEFKRLYEGMRKENQTTGLIFKAEVPFLCLPLVFKWRFVR